MFVCFGMQVLEAYLTYLTTLGVLMGVCMNWYAGFKGILNLSDQSQGVDGCLNVLVCRF